MEGRPMVTSEAVLVEFLNFFSAFREDDPSGPFDSASLRSE